MAACWLAGSAGCYMLCEAISALQFSPVGGRQVASAIMLQLVISNILLVLALSTSGEGQNTPESAPPCGGYYGQLYYRLHPPPPPPPPPPTLMINISLSRLWFLFRLPHRHIQPRGLQAEMCSLLSVKVLRLVGYLQWRYLLFTMRCEHYSYNYNQSSPYYRHCYLSYHCTDPLPAIGNWISGPKVRPSH